MYRIERREKGTSPLVTKDEQQKKRIRDKYGEEGRNVSIGTGDFMGE